MNTLRALGRMALAATCALVAPHRCPTCDGPTARAAVFCASCARGLERRAANGPFLVAPLAYGGPIAAAITRFKYADRPDLAAPLAEILRAASAGLSVDLVVPVPLHPVRLAERGYNQSALLARPVARHLAVPFAAHGLARTRDTPKQASLDRDARTRNVEGAFLVVGDRARGGRVLLVDDVCTTGATLAACAAALRAAGAAEVRALVVAAVDAG